MDARAIEARLEEDGWTQKATKALTGDLGALDGAALRPLADVALAREHGGMGADAARLALAALTTEVAEAGTDDEQEARRWARVRLCGVMRRHGTAAMKKKLDETDRASVDAWAAPIDAKIVAGSDEEAEAAVKAALKGMSDEPLAAALEGASALVTSLEKRPVVACALARAALEAHEQAHAPSGDAAAALADWEGILWGQLFDALAVLPDDHDARAGTLKWMLLTKGGEVRVGRPPVPTERLSPRDQAHVLETLQKKAVKSNTARRALLRAGHTLLDRDAYLELCREHGHARGIVLTLLESDEVEAAAKEARGAIADDDTDWEIAKLFEARGRTDLAIDMLHAVAADTVSSALEHWLAERLTSEGRADEVVALYRNRFHKRPALPQYQALRDRVDGKAWSALRAELLEELKTRRLHRPILDIAADERDVDLLASVAPELDDDQADHAKQMLEAWLERATAPRPKVEAILGQIEKSTAKADVSPKEIVANEPIPKRVRHKKFGEGDVVGWSGEREQRKLEIDFADVGKKTLLSRFVEVIE